MEQLVEYNEGAMIREFSDGISDYIHGEARDHIASSIASAGEALDDTIGAMAYQILSQVSEQVAEMGPEAVTMDILLPLATETIDYLVEIALAVSAPVADEQDLRERSFIKVVELHMAAVQDDPEQKAIAEEMLAEMMQDGSFEEAEAYVSEKIRAEGGDPDRARAMGAGMVQQNPLAQGMQQPDPALSPEQMA